MGSPWLAAVLLAAYCAVTWTPAAWAQAPGMPLAKAPTTPPVPPWRAERGTKDCVVVAEIDSPGGENHILFVYAPGSDSLAVVGDRDFVAAGVQIDDLPRIEFQCVESGCVARYPTGLQGRVLAQMRAGTSVFVDVKPVGREKIGPVRISLEKFAAEMDEAIACQKAMR